MEHRDQPLASLHAIALSIVAAILYFVSFLNFDLYGLSWVCLVPVLVAIRGTTPRRALWLGTIFGAVTNAGGYYWITHLLEEFGHLPLALAIVGFALLCIYQGFLLAVVLGLVRRAQRDLGIAPVWSLAVVFPALELAYPLLFPSYIGNSQYAFTTITQSVDVTGMAGLTLLIALVNGAIYECIEAHWQARRIAHWRVIVPATAFALALVYGLIRLPQIDAQTASAPTLNVGLIQTNIGARDKAANPEEFIRRHREMSRELVSNHPETELIVWPESAYNRVLFRSQKNLALEITDGIDRPVLFGALTLGTADSPQDREVFNSLLLADSDGAVLGVYDKVELLAFGETFPLSNTLPILGKLSGNNWFTRGTSLQHLQLRDTAILPMICYEDILPGLVRRLWRHGGPADVLVNGTNDSWYGDTHQPMLHLVVASFRSIETRRALIRVTNTGISAIVDPAGRIVQRTGQWTRATLVAKVPLIKDGSSSFYMKTGNVLGWLCCALTAWGYWRCRRAVRTGR
jgi:apolipoprotein N-acyltransferase